MQCDKLYKCICNDRGEFNVDVDGTSIKCTQCGIISTTNIQFLTEQNDELRCKLKSLLTDNDNLKEAVLTFQKSINDMEQSLASSDNQKEHFKRNIFCSLVAAKHDYPLSQTKRLFNEYFGETNE